jgi:hypothetical protein
LLTQEALQALMKGSVGADVNASSRRHSPPSAAGNEVEVEEKEKKEKLKLQTGEAH